MKQLNLKEQLNFDDTVIVCQLGNSNWDYVCDVLNNDMDDWEDGEPIWGGLEGGGIVFNFDYIKEGVLQSLLNSGMEVNQLLNLIPEQNYYLNQIPLKEKRVFLEKTEEPINVLIDDILKHTQLIIYKGKDTKGKTMIIEGKDELKKHLNKKGQTIRVTEVSYS